MVCAAIANSPTVSTQIFQTLQNVCTYNEDVHKPKCHGIDTNMYNSLIPFANFGGSQYSILKLIATCIHNLACSYLISAVH